jgi:N-acetylglutamate synthase-like GNAT family acetyltransferase
MDYLISEDKNLLDANFVHHELTRSYWAKNIPLETVVKSISHSMCFGVYFNAQQIGFARAITDQATFAYLCDVIITEEHRGKGAGKQLMEFIMKHEALQGLRRFMLATLDAHSLYAKFGFTPVKNPQRLMEITVPDIYSDKTDARIA